jgi:cytochrome c-type biogenesis protein CcmF
LISFGFCLFVASSIISEFFKGATAIGHKNQINFAHAVVELTHRNTRRYGGYLVHMGIVLMFVGWTGSAFNTNVTAEIPVGGSFELGKYKMRVAKINTGENPNYKWDAAVLDVTKNGSPIGQLEPERRYYKAAQQGLGHVALRNRLDEDLYINFASADDKATVVTLQAYIFPLVSWIWIGTLVLIAGTLIALVPSKVARQYARTQVVAMAETPVAIEN